MGDIKGIPDDVLEHIFVLIASPAHLIRAASTCKRWHGIVAGARFLSRFLTLNRRHLVAGSYYNGLQQEPPAFVASSSSSPPVVDGRRFSLDFLWSGDNVVIDPESWRIADSHGGLVLLSMEPYYDPPYPIWHVHMVVCEPLTRRYKVIPPMVTCGGYYYRSGPFLLDGDRPGGIDLSNFRLMCVAYHPDRGCYRGSMFTASRDLDGSCSWHVYAIDDGKSLRSLMGRTRASVYWHGGGRAVTALDRSTAELSSSELPESTEEWDEQGTEVNVAVGRDGEPRILAIAPGCSVVTVFVAAMARGGGEWELEKAIEMSAVASGLPGYLPSYFSDDGEAVAWIDVTADAAAMVTVSVCSVTTSWGCMDSSWSFRLDLESLEAELVDMDSGVLELDVAFPCELPWPPVLHART